MTGQSKRLGHRAYALDALRGYAILTMVLSATVVYSILPGWMYHAQTPPPTHVYQAELSGLTWVDLVFPFFLFAMGAAFPFSVRKRREKGDSMGKLFFEALKRGAQLAFFAIFIQHFYPYMLSNPQDVRAWLLAIVCFIILFPMFMRIPLQMPDWAHTAIKLGAYAVAVVMLAFTDYSNGVGFNLFTSNIIILLLANMAIFGTSVYLFTMYSWWTRVVVMLALMGVVLSSQMEGSWAAWIWNYTPVPWMYNFAYLRYLFIVLPGSMAGDILLEWMNDARDKNIMEISRSKAWGVWGLTFGIVVANLVLLYNHQSFAAMVVSAVLLVGIHCLTKDEQGSGLLWHKLLVLGGVFLMVGLCFEPFEGGIKKDGPTFGYLFITSGLATVTLIFFHIWCDYFKARKSSAFLVMSGQNPMIAYVACDLLVYPVLNLLGLTKYLEIFHSGPWLGFLQGVLLTSLTLLITMFFSRIKWFWRT